MHIAKTRNLFGAEFFGQRIFNINIGNFFGESVKNIGINIGLGRLRCHIKRFIQIAANDNEAAGMIDWFKNHLFAARIHYQRQHVALCHHRDFV